MKIFTAALLLLTIASICCADQFVSGYTRKDGTYVSGYTRSDRDSSYNNNYSTKGNTNPYTGLEGTRSRTYNDRTPSYNTRTFGNPGYESSYSRGSYGSSSYRNSGSSSNYGGSLLNPGGSNYGKSLLVD